MLGLGAGVLAKLLWDALNWKPPSTKSQDVAGHTYLINTVNDDLFQMRYSSRQTTKNSSGCDGTPFPDTQGNVGTVSLNAFGIGYRLLATTAPNKRRCGPGINIPSGTVQRIQIVRKNGTFGGFESITGNGTTYNQSSNNDIDFPLFGVSALYGGNVYPAEQVNPGVLPQTPGLIPAVPAPSPQTASEPQLVPVPTPAQPLAPAAVPGSAPAPAPTPAPGGLPAGQPAVPPAVATVPRLVRTVTTSSPGSQTQTITAGGVSQAPAAPIVSTTPPGAVLIGGVLVGGPGTTPPQNPGGTAAELGRLEGKAELTLSKLGQLAPLLESLDVLTALGEWLLSANGGVTYTLQPPCGTDANGDPLPPVEVVVPPTIGVEVATIARLDALAMLIDEHKQMRQPICKGKPTGSPVTVTAVEVE